MRLSRIATIVLMGVGAALGGAQTAAGATFTPLADTYVDASHPSSNFGSSSAIRADSSPTKTSYLRFDVQGVGPVSSALLKVYVETSSSTGVTLSSVANTTWTEKGLTYTNAPPLGQVIAQSGAISSGTWLTFDVRSVVTGDGPVSFALTTTSSSALRFTSKEGANAPQLIAPAPPPVTYFNVTPTGDGTYNAASVPAGTTYTGTLKFVVESAAVELDQGAGGTIHFTAGVFDYGSEYFKVHDLENIVFDGEGIDVTTIRNSNSGALDTEPFDFSGTNNVTVRDMTVFAGGAARSTSDALDFDRGNNSVVENVKVSGSRGRGIVFDGKNAGWNSAGNRVTNCVIVGTPSDGIELLASSYNRIEGCTITDVGGHGIQMTKSSTTADQPNKKASNNVVTGNTITNSGLDGINVNSSDANLITGNTLLNNSNLSSGRDGVRVGSVDGITCDSNEVRSNTATDTQTPKTQNYGLRIASGLCNGTIVADNSLAGNKTGAMLDQGTGTIIQSSDTQGPTVPTGLTPTSVTSSSVSLAWTASTDNVGVAGYRVYRNGNILGSVNGTTTSFTDDTVTPGSTYAYAVDAVDAAGNASGQSDPVPVTTPGGTPGVTTFTPTADTYVDAGVPASNFGSSSTLRADADPDRRSYLRFDVTGLSGTITSVKLRIYANSASSVGHDVRDVSDDTWSENGMIYADAPALGPSVGASGPFTAGGYVEVDVTSLVTGSGLYSFAITTPGSTAISYASRESANKPQLVVTTS